MTAAVIFFGGNGHCAARLSLAREAARTLEPEPGSLSIGDAEYPGFEGRPRPRDLEQFLDGVCANVSRHTAAGPVALGYATGIGALIALDLRARGVLDVPLVFQGPVLWGLESRVLPRVARGGLAPVLGRALRTPAFLSVVWRRHFLRPMPADRFRELALGYRRCLVVGDLFRWLDPAFLRSLRTRLTARPGSLERIDVWSGEKDRVVGPAEVRATEDALAVTWPRRTFPAWGHYPMIDDPDDWVRAVAAAAHPSHGTPPL